MRFNLVIESLIFSSRLDTRYIDAIILFQSRNRESYLFKAKYVPALNASTQGFNLVIESLIFSRLEGDLCKRVSSIVSIS